MHQLSLFAQDEPKLTPDSSILSVATYLAEVLPRRTDRSPTWRRDAASAFPCLGRAVDRPLSGIMMTHDDLAAAVKAAKSRCQALGANQRSLIKCALKDLVAKGHQVEPIPKLSPEWEVLFNHLPLDPDPDCPNFERIGLLRFLQFLSERGTFPSNVKLDAVQAFERQLAARCQALD